MTPKKTNASKPANKSAKKPASESANKPTSPAPSAVPGAVPVTAVVHDLVGGAVVALPLELKEIVGDEAFKDLLAELASHVMTVIIRRPGHIIYVHAQLMAQDLNAARQTRGEA